MKTTVPRSPRDSSRLGSIPTLVALLVGATVMLAMDVPARGDTTEVAWPRPQHCPEGTVTIQEPDGDLLGGEANASTSAKFTVEVSWPFTAKPTRVTA